MIPIPNNTSPAVDSRTVTSLNKRLKEAVDRDTVETLNLGPQAQQTAPTRPAAPPRQTVPPRPTVPPQPVPQPIPQPVQQPPVYQRETPPSVYQRPSAQPRPGQQPIPQPVQPPRPTPPPQPRPAPVPQMPPERPIPTLVHKLQKGQKSNLAGPLQKLKVCFGWNVKDARCDVDASAFLVTDTGKVPGDEWFVFYGQDTSPDRSVTFAVTPNSTDREEITVDLQRLDPRIKKVVFVLTIDEAIPKNLNFSMLKDVYVRLLNGATGQEIVSFAPAEYYANVTSMTMGELYLYNGQWKFNPVGNGIHQDLAGQCGVYGVQIS